MLKPEMFALFLYLCLILQLAPHGFAIWPLPSKISTGNSTLWMSSGVRFEIRGVQKVSFVLKFDTKVVTLIAIIEAIQEKAGSPSD